MPLIRGLPALTSGYFLSSSINLLQHRPFFGKGPETSNKLHKALDALTRRMLEQALVRIGAPADVVQWILDIQP